MTCETLSGEHLKGLECPYQARYLEDAREILVGFVDVVFLLKTVCRPTIVRAELAPLGIPVPGVAESWWPWRGLGTGRSGRVIRRRVAPLAVYVRFALCERCVVRCRCDVALFMGPDQASALRLRA